jgi:Immunity protein 70
MAVGVTVGSITDELGAPAFVHSFFSTVSAHCEPNGWGSRFPHLMKELYQGRLQHQNALLALGELRQAKAKLSSLPPSAVVWEIENRQSKPPWGDSIAADITSLGNYFVSSAGRDVFSILEEALAASAAEQRDAILQ